MQQSLLKLFSDFIKILSEKYFYRDNQIVLFSKTHCEISVQPRYYEKYLDLAKVYNDLSLDQSLKNFIDWLSMALLHKAFEGKVFLSC